MRRDADKTNSNKLRTLYHVNILILCGITLAALGVAIFLFIRLQTVTTALTDQTATQSDEGEDSNIDDAVARAERNARSDERRQILLEIQSSYESGNSTTTTLRNLFPEDIIVSNGGRYYFYPVQTEISPNRIDSSDLEIDSNGLVNYIGVDDSVTLHQGMDVSSVNGTIDWEKVAEEPYTFVMIRAGYKNAEGEITEDTEFDRNFDGAISNGLEVGCYIDLEVDDEAEAAADAAFILNQLTATGGQMGMPIAIRLEVPEESSEYNSRTMEEWTECVKAFCEQIENAGYTPMIYGNIAAFQLLLNLKEVEKYERWVADYSGELYFPYEYAMWQHSITGEVSGIGGNVALNVYVDYGEQAAE